LNWLLQVLSKHEVAMNTANDMIKLAMLTLLALGACVGEPDTKGVIQTADVPATCGNGVCDAEETCSLCLADCSCCRISSAFMTKTAAGTQVSGATTQISDPWTVLVDEDDNGITISPGSELVLTFERGIFDRNQQSELTLVGDLNGVASGTSNTGDCSGFQIGNETTVTNVASNAIDVQVSPTSISSDQWISIGGWSPQTQDFDLICGGVANARLMKIRVGSSVQSVFLDQLVIDDNVCVEGILEPDSFVELSPEAS